MVDPRIEAAFAAVPREAHLRPPPWRVFGPGGTDARETRLVPELYRDVLVALDPARGVNNGQPSLHAAWLALAAPRAGETVLHVGAGGGYYTAILARLAAPEGRVEAYEIDGELAALARASLAGVPGVAVHPRSALGGSLPPADLVYVNAGAAAPDPAWLRALRPGGRLIFPWQPAGPGGLTLLLVRRGRGFSVAASTQVGFVPCEGAPEAPGVEPGAVLESRSAWLAAERPPDATATACLGEVWLSREEP